MKKIIIAITVTTALLLCLVAGSALFAKSAMEDVARDALARLVAPAQVADGPGVVLLGGRPVPLHGLFPALLRALARLTAPAQVALGPGVALLGGRPVPLHGLLPALLHALAGLIAPAQGAQAGGV